MNFQKKLVLHQNHKPNEKQELLEDLYEIYKLNIENYKYIALLIKKYNQGKDSSNDLPKEYVNLMINHYIVEQLIKELFTKEQQKLFYQYIENLALLYNENYPKNLFKINNEPIQNNYSIAVILLLCIRTLKKENLLKIKPEKLNIRLTINKEENIKLQIMNNLPKKETITRSIKYNETVNMLKSLKEKYPNLKAPFMTTSEFEKHTKTKAPKHQHYLTDGLSVLEMMIHNSDKVVYEEQLDLTKCLKYIK